MCHIDDKDGSLSSKVGAPGSTLFGLDTSTASQSLASRASLISSQMDSFAPLLSMEPSDNPIVALTANDGRCLFVARANGDVVRYRLPELWPEVCIHATDKRPVRIEINCDAT